MRVLLLAVIAALVGCDIGGEASKTAKPKQPKKELRGDIADAWGHDVGAGVPHRMSILRDGTEILTIGQHDHGRWLLLVRYADESRFTVINDEGELHGVSAECEE